jgi:hypothetical protein
MWRAWLLLLTAALACGGGDNDAQQRYKKMVEAQRAKTGAPPDQLVSIGMSKGQSGTDVGIVFYSGGDRHDLTGIARTVSGDRDYQLDGGKAIIRASDRSYGFKLETEDTSAVRWKVRLYPDKIKIADNDNDTAPRRIRTESPERATLAGPNEEPLGEIVFDGTNTIVKNSAGVERYRKATAKLEPAYGVFLFDRMPNTEKYIVLAELMARNR